MKRLVKHWFAWIRGSDEGSGTISGVALIAVAAIMLGAAASAGNLLLCLHRAQNAADLASVAAANALYSGSSDPCSVAERTISGNNATIGSCTIEGEDVLVEAQGRHANAIRIACRQTVTGGADCLRISVVRNGTLCGKSRFVKRDLST